MDFKDIFHTNFSVVNSAHARVNLIGEHTDYTGGYVLPALLNFKTTIQISKNNKNQYQVKINFLLRLLDQTLGLLS